MGWWYAAASRWEGGRGGSCVRAECGAASWRGRLQNARSTYLKLALQSLRLAVDPSFTHASKGMPSYLRTKGTRRNTHKCVRVCEGGHAYACVSMGTPLRVECDAGR